MPSFARAFAPGRVNLIGEHTDYNGGLALPFAVGPGVTVTARRTSGEAECTRGEAQRTGGEAQLTGEEVRARAIDLDEDDVFPLGAPPEADGWRAFVRGAVAELVRHGVAVPGADLEITGDLPRGAGLSSSAALSVALCLALAELAGATRPDDVALARICSRIEHDWVGAQTGLLDQLAVLSGEPDHAVCIDFATLARSRVPLRLGDHRLVILDSGESHDLANSGYNRRREECAEACERLGIETLSEAEIGAAEAVLPESLLRRVRHVLSENRRVQRAVWWLERGDTWEVGPLLDASHASLRDDYEVSTPAVEAAIERLHAAGAIGARIIGGGFGGSVLGMLAPGADPPEGAVEVVPSAGARLLDS